nr:coatomer subunit delta-like isoform X2 [Tanacetum cinerariifolium]
MKARMGGLAQSIGMPPCPSDQFKNIMGSKDPNKSFPVSESGDGLLKWKMQSKDVLAVPLTSKFLYVPVSILDDGLILLEVTSIVSIKGGPPPKYS